MARRAELEAARRRKARRNQSVTLGVIVIIAVLIVILVTQGGSSKSKASTSKANTSTTAKPTTTTTGTPVAVAPVCPKVDGSSPTERKFTAAPPTCINPAKHYSADVTTDVGSFTISLDVSAAPKTVNNFVFLARYHYFDGIIFHRVIPDFVVQGGDPTGTGSGGPGYSFADELPKAGAYQIGSVAMANSGPNTNGSQFFIVVGSQGVALPPKYSLFGQVTSGMSVVNQIAKDGSASGTPTVTHKMTKVTITES